MGIATQRRGLDPAYQRPVFGPLSTTINASANRFVLIAPCVCKVVYFATLVDTTIAAHDTNYWSVMLANLTQAEDLMSAAKTTKVTGGTAMTADVPWTLTLDQNTEIAQGDVLELQFTKAASADNLSMISFGLKYVRI